MRISKHILVVALAAMLPGAALQAQTYNDTVRTNTWTIYGYGGVGGYHGLRDVTDAGTRSALTPDLALGVKYNIKPWVRVGLEVGYNLLKSKNDGIAQSTIVNNGVSLLGHNDGVQTITKSIVVDNHDQHTLGADLNADFNLLDIFGGGGKWNIWLGTGVGYMFGWDRGTKSTVISEETVSQGDDHYNVGNHDYITSDGTDTETNALYIPARLSVEYDISPMWTIGARGQYKYLPLDHRYTPEGIWGAGVSIAYNFVGKTYGPKAVAARHSAEVADLNDQINALRLKNVNTEDEKAKLAVELAKTIDALNAANKALEESKNNFKDPILYPVFFELDKTVITPQQKQNVAAAAKLMNDYPNAKLVIKGYASTEGPLDHNMDLSVRRAAAVTKMLVDEYGISADRITSEGCGITAELFEVFELNRVSMIYVGTK